MYRWQVTDRIVAGGVIPVIRAHSSADARAVSVAIADGGVASLELTMTVPGTVLDAETARACLLAGAEFLVSPGA